MFFKRYISHNIISNKLKISCEPQHDKNITNMLSFIKVNLQYLGMKHKPYNLYIYPSSYKDYMNAIEMMQEYKIKYLNEKINLNSGSFLVPNRILTNFPLQHKDCYKSPIKDRWETFNMSDDTSNETLYRNGDKNFEVIARRVYFPYKREYILKISPNIVNIRARPQLNREKLTELLKELNYHGMIEPRTPNGSWKIYISDETSYITIFNKPFLIDGELIEVYPFYGFSTAIPIESEKCDRQINIYSTDSAINKNTISQDLNIPIQIIRSQYYEKGQLFQLYLDCIDKYKNVRFLNGTPIGGSSNYTMVFEDAISPQNIESNILNTHVNKNTPRGYFDEFLSSYIFEEATEKFPFLNIYTRDFNEYESILKNGITVNNTKYMFFKQSIPKYIYNCIALKSINNTPITQDEIRSKFNCNSHMTNDQTLAVIRTNSECSPNIIFQNNPIETKLILRRGSIERFNNSKYINMCYLVIPVDADLNMIDNFKRLQFLYKTISMTVLSTDYEHFIKIIFGQHTDQYLKSLNPMILTSNISTHRTSISVKSSVFDVISHDLDMMNIPTEVETINEWSHIYPKITSIDDLDMIANYKLLLSFRHRLDTKFTMGHDVTIF